MPSIARFGNEFTVLLLAAIRRVAGTHVADGGWQERTSEIVRSVPAADGPSRQVQTAAGRVSMNNLFNRFVREEQGRDLINYAVIAITALGTCNSEQVHPGGQLRDRSIVV
jgi:hypothetical protein